MSFLTCYAILPSLVHGKHEHLSSRTTQEFVDGQIAAGRYSSVSEYVRELIRDDEKRKAQERLEALLLEGFARRRD